MLTHRFILYRWNQILEKNEDIKLKIDLFEAEPHITSDNIQKCNYSTFCN